MGLKSLTIKVNSYYEVVNPSDPNNTVHYVRISGFKVRKFKPRTFIGYYLSPEGDDGSEVLFDDQGRHLLKTGEGYYFAGPNDRVEIGKEIQTTPMTRKCFMKVKRSAEGPILHILDWTIVNANYANDHSELVRYCEISEAEFALPMEVRKSMDLIASLEGRLD